MAVSKKAPQDQTDKKISVVATKLGYHGLKRRDKGERFVVRESEFSKKWMERLTDRESREVKERLEEEARALKDTREEDDSDSVI